MKHFTFLLLPKRMVGRKKYASFKISNNFDVKDAPRSGKAVKVDEDKIKILRSKRSATKLLSEQPNTYIYIKNSRLNDNNEVEDFSESGKPRDLNLEYE